MNIDIRSIHMTVENISLLTEPRLCLILIIGITHDSNIFLHINEFIFRMISINNYAAYMQRGVVDAIFSAGGGQHQSQF